MNALVGFALMIVIFVILFALVVIVVTVGPYFSLAAGIVLFLYWAVGSRVDRIRSQRIFKGEKKDVQTDV